MSCARWAVLAFVLAGSAFGDEDSAEKAQARVLLAQGNALFERGDLKGALVDFRAAYALYPSPKLLVNCAAAERELGDIGAAATDLRHYLDEAGEDDPTLAERARADLKALERRLGRIALSGWPARSTVEVDGRPGRDPTYVKPGSHRVRVRAPSGAELDRDVEVGIGEVVDFPAPTPGPSVPPLRRVEKKKSKGWVAAVVAVSVIVVAGVVAVGVTLGTQPGPQPLTGELGTFKFSDFH